MAVMIEAGGVSSTDAWAGAQRVLCVRLDNMGDVLMTTPALHAMRESGPANRHMALLASRSGAMLAKHLVDIDEVFALDAPWVKHDVIDPRALRRTAAALRRARFDAAIIFTVYSQNPLPAALLCHLAGIPLVLAHCRENPYHLLSHWVRETEPEHGIRHEVQRQLDLVAAVGARAADTRLRFATHADDRASLAGKLRAEGIATPGGWILLHPGATAASRRYSDSGYARAISMLDTGGRPILLTGGCDERDLAQRVIAQSRTASRLVNMAGLLTLGELACLIEAADLLISNNTGPVHMAAALQTPIVDLYALTNPQHTPWLVKSRVLSHDVPCKYCYRSVCPEGHNDCLNGIPPEEIALAARQLLETVCTPLESMPRSTTVPPHWSPMAG